MLSRKDAFFPAFERHATVMVKAAVALREMLAGGDQVKPCFQEILELGEPSAAEESEKRSSRSTDVPQASPGD
jgi:hypothetical protein